MSEESTEVVLELQKLGWEFMPVAPEEWQWMKFGSSGMIEASQGSATWVKDLSIARSRAKRYV